MKHYRKVVLSALFAVLLCGALSFIKSGTAQAFSCPNDPEYPGAGVVDPWLGQPQHCAKNPHYEFTGGADNPTITYSKSDEANDGPDEVAVLSLKDKSADPLVWEGTATYSLNAGANHVIDISIGRGQFTCDTSGTPAARLDKGVLTKGVKIFVNDTMTQFAKDNNIAVECSGSSNLNENYSCSDPANDTNCVIFARYVLPLIDFLSIGVGIVVTIMIIIGGIQYSSAGGDPNKVAAAKSRIFNAILGLIAFAFLFAFLQWIVPGGIF